MPSAPRLKEVRVDWLGSESFRFTSSLGTKIITNPYLSGFPEDLRPDVVLISTERSDANNIDAFDNSPTVFRGAVGIGVNTATGIRIRGIPTYDNPERESVGPLNLVFLWTLDGVRFCYLGNVQNALTMSQVQQIGSVDVLFLPVGTPAGLSNAQRSTILGQVRPRVVVPMGSRSAIEAWAGGFPKVYRLPGSSVLFTRETLPFEQTALVFGSVER